MTLLIEGLGASELRTRAKRALASLRFCADGESRLSQMPQDLGTLEAPTLALVFWLETQATAAILADHRALMGAFGLPPALIGWDTGIAQDTGIGWDTGKDPSPPSLDQKE